MLAGPHAKPAYPTQASLRTLAARTAAALSAKGVRKVTLSYDSSLFVGQTKADGWKTNYIPDGEVSPVHALAIDEGRRIRRMRAPRVADPPQLRRRGVREAAGQAGHQCPARYVRPRRPPGPPSSPSVESPPLYALVEHTLTHSDNDFAEALAAARRHQGGPGGVLRGRCEGGRRGAPAARRRAAGQAVRRQRPVHPQPHHPQHARPGHRHGGLRASTPSCARLASGMPVAGFTGTLGKSTRFARPGSRARSGSYAPRPARSRASTRSPGSPPRGRAAAHLRVHGRQGAGHRRAPCVDRAGGHRVPVA